MLKDFAQCASLPYVTRNACSLRSPIEQSVAVSSSFTCSQQSPAPHQTHPLPADAISYTWSPNTLGGKSSFLWQITERITLDDSHSAVHKQRQTALINVALFRLHLRFSSIELEVFRVTQVNIWRCSQCEITPCLFMGNNEYSAAYLVLTSVQNCHCSTVDFTDLYRDFQGRQSQTYLCINMKYFSYISKL